MNVYYFEEPTVGYCRECGEAAIYTDMLRCPNNKEHELTLFVWDGESPHPESEVD